MAEFEELESVRLPKDSFDLGIIKMRISAKGLSLETTSEQKINSIIQELIASMSKQMELGDSEIIYEVTNIENGSIVTIFRSSLKVVGDSVNSLVLIGTVLVFFGTAAEYKNQVEVCVAEEYIQCEVEFNVDEMVTTYIEVQENEKIQDLVNKLNIAGVNDEQIIVAIFDYNPDAFPTNKLDSLVPKYVLKVPSKKIIQNYTPFDTNNRIEKLQGN